MKYFRAQNPFRPLITSTTIHTPLPSFIHSSLPFFLPLFLSLSLFLSHLLSFFPSFFHSRCTEVSTTLFRLQLKTCGMRQSKGKFCLNGKLSLDAFLKKYNSFFGSTRSFASQTYNRWGEKNSGANIKNFVLWLKRIFQMV